MHTHMETARAITASMPRTAMAFRFATALAACAAFPAFILLTLALTTWVSLPAVPRYDLIFLLCIAFQVIMLATRMESPREFATIFLFHAMGTTMEIVKVNNGGWQYPDPSVIRLWNVPLYSGFMYASIGSFMLAAWKRFDIQLTRFPAWPAAAALGTAIYTNFITNVWWPDLKPLLLAATLLLFRNARLHWTFEDRARSLRLIYLFLTLGPVVWLAENWGTLFGSWQYPRQAISWTSVPPDKILSWIVLVVVSFLIVAAIRHETIAHHSQHKEKP